MVVKLYIRNAYHGQATLRVDFKREENDTPRISNLGLDIKNVLQEYIDKCEKECAVKC